MPHFLDKVFYYGGKSRAASLIWERLGDTINYVEPFLGSGAVLLSRPTPPRIETVNDLDCHLVNLWRAMQRDPQGLAAQCDEPVNEITQHAFHLWLMAPGRRQTFEEALMTDPDYYDLMRAGRWLAGIAMWIGRGWCSGNGPWQSIDGQLVETNAGGDGIPLGDAGRGVSRQRVHLGDAGQGVHRQRVHLGDAGQGSEGLHVWFAALAARLRSVRVCCGDWTRVCGASVTWRHGLTGVVLDPPYLREERDDVYVIDTPHVAEEVRQWAIAHGEHPLLRIALCGYETAAYTMPDTWEKVQWTTNGGYGNLGQGRGRANRTREVIWFSPHCLAPLQGKLL